MSREAEVVKEVTEFFGEYVRVTGQFKDPIVQTDWFLVPSMIDSSALPGSAAKSWTVYETEDALKEFRRGIEEAYSGLNLSVAECRELGVWPLNERAGLVLAAARRHKEDGSYFPETRHLYLVVLGDEGWRIYATISLDPEYLGPGEVAVSEDYW